MNLAWEMLSAQPFAIGVGLEKDHGRSIFRGVGGNGEGCSRVREV